MTPPVQTHHVASLLRRVVDLRTTRARQAMVDQMRERRDALAAQLDTAQQQDSELDRAIALLADLPYARAILHQIQAQLGRELDAMHGAVQTLDDLLAEVAPCAESPAS